MFCSARTLLRRQNHLHLFYVPSNWTRKLLFHMIATTIDRSVFYNLAGTQLTQREYISGGTEKKVAKTNAHDYVLGIKPK